MQKMMDISVALGGLASLQDSNARVTSLRSKRLQDRKDSAPHSVEHEVECAALRAERNAPAVRRAPIPAVRCETGHEGEPTC